MRRVNGSLRRGAVRLQRAHPYQHSHLTAVFGLARILERIVSEVIYRRPRGTVCVRSKSGCTMGAFRRSAGTLSLFFLVSVAYIRAEEEPRMSDERLVFQTRFGDLEMVRTFKREA